MRRRLLLACAPLVLLGACATTNTAMTEAAPHAPRTQAEPAAPAAADSAYGLFLAGNAAMSEGRNSEAARFLDIARAQSGDDPAVAERAFTAALISGDIDKAAALAPEGDNASDGGKRLGRLAKVVAALAANKPKVAKVELGGDGIGFPHRQAAALLGPWVAAANGDAEGAVVRPQVRGDPGVEYYGQLGQAALFERAKRFDEAETDLKTLTSGASPSDIAVLAYGGFLERRGRRPDALALYDAALQRNPNSLGVLAAKARVTAKKAPPPLTTLKEGAAFALLAPAASMITAKNDLVGLAYLRLSLKLDPNRNDAWLMLGDLLLTAGDVEGARAAYDKPKAGTAEFPAAQAKLAWSRQSAGDKAGALKLARTAAATGDREGRLTLSDLLRANEQYPEAITLLDGLIAEAKDGAQWQLYYARGQAYERSGDWKKAEADLMKALSLRPEEPELLNYLGYAWIDRGERLQEALAMVERAVGANPRSGAIVDSLGWAHYRLGDYKKAVEVLEQAVELEAGDPEINNHLGDAYWMVGRKDEAGFQWKRVLTLKPDDKVKADAEKKIASGVGPSPKLAGQ